MRPRIYIFCALAVIAAALFVRLGFWQLGRLRERQAYNRMFTRQQLSQPVEFGTLPRQPDSARFRGARLEGIYDYEHELVLSPRSRRGSPGVELLTPVRRRGTDTVVVVDRGWVYSPDAASVDQKRWRERDTAAVLGYVEHYLPDTVVTSASKSNVIRRVTRAELASKLPYPVAPYYLIAVGDTLDLAHPARRDLPALDEGSHKSYAFQWFTFATIALVGAGIVIHRERRLR